MALERQTIEDALTTREVGRVLHVHGSLPSTNDEALALAREGAAHGTVVVAEEQTAGRGRRGREWSSPAGVNLYLSVVLRPPLPPHRAPELVSVVAIAGAETLRAFGAEAGIKWPNDLQIGGKKVAGILTELSATSQRVVFVVAGIGFNLNASPSDFPPELRSLATSLSIETGEVTSRSRFAATFLNHLETWLDRHEKKGFRPIRERYLALSTILGERVRLVDGETTLEGIVEDIDETGALILEDDDGGYTRILTGDVHTVRLAPSRWSDTDIDDTE